MELSRDMNTVGGTGMSGNCSAASAKVANEPAIGVAGPRIVHLTRGTTASQWTCRALARDTGKASSYQ